MSQSRKNVGVVRGRWGEDVAVAYLRRNGLVVMDRNIRPCADDRRLEIDILAYDLARDTLVFAEVKQHARRLAGAPQLLSVNRRKRENLLRACNVWRWQNRWGRNYRFDVIEVYGTPGMVPEVEHVENVRLFSSRERYAQFI